MDAARRDAATRRERASAAARAYEEFLEERAIPAFRAMANVLRAEGIPFEVMTPSGGARLVADSNRDDVIELELDTSLDPPQPLVITMQTRGSRILRTERLVKEGSPISEITEDDVRRAAAGADQTLVGLIEETDMSRAMCHRRPGVERGGHRVRRRSRWRPAGSGAGCQRAAAAGGAAAARGDRDDGLDRRARADRVRAAAASGAADRHGGAPAGRPAREAGARATEVASAFARQVQDIDERLRDFRGTPAERARAGSRTEAHATRCGRQRDGAATAAERRIAGRGERSPTNRRAGRGSISSWRSWSGC